ncbi:MAG: hypothetical protein QOG10_2764 [Kribbellaceae bacterium]|nr:hypothetical protein [Kribbellaceae bacterium]
MNEALSAHLDEAGWSPRALAREINALFGGGAVSETAPYYWRDSGGAPRQPLPAQAAYALSRRLGRPVDVESLWPGTASDSAVQLATSGIDLPWTPASTVQIAKDWVSRGLTDRRAFLAVSGTVLTRAVFAYLAAEVAPGHFSVAEDDHDSPLVAQIEQSIPLLQQLDDAQGGAANLKYVGAQVRAVSLVLGEGGHSASITRRLLMALADLAQLAGWMAHDADQQGLAQRYLFTALRAAHDSGNKAMAGHVLADLSVQATFLNEAEDAIALGEAAARVTVRSTASVRASVASRLAHAYAGAGMDREFSRSHGEALDLIDRRNIDQDPTWMYYLTPNHLDCQAGYSLIMMGRRQRDAGDDGGGRQRVRKGQALLRTGAHNVSVGKGPQRRALYEGSWLALGAATRGEVEEACQTGRTALARLGQVRSPRSVILLRHLASELNRRTRNEFVAAFVPELRAALARQPM